MDPKFIVNLSGKSYCLYQGILDDAHALGLQGIETQLIQIPSEENGHTAIVKAIVRLKDGSVFEDYADASPRNVNSRMATALIRMASTRSKGRALRDATNNGATMFEELPDLDDVAPPRANGALMSPPASEPPSGYTIACSGRRCGMLISTDQAVRTRDQHGEPYCYSCESLLAAAARGRQRMADASAATQGSKSCCSKPGCGVVLTQGQVSVSTARFGAALCPTHQKAADEEEKP